MSVLTRRRFLALAAAGSVSVSAATVAAASAYDTTEDLELTRYEIPIPELATSFDGYRIGFLSDLHLGPFVNPEWLRSALERVRDEHVDLIALGGDFLWKPEWEWSSFPEAWRNQKLARASFKALPGLTLEQLENLFGSFTAPDGLVGILGNHDRWTAPRAWIGTHPLGDVRLLVNEPLILSRGESKLELFGSDDYWTGIPRAPKDQNPPHPRILLAHNPDYVSTVLERNLFRFELALCGHTHGGQIRMPGVGAITYHVRDLRFAEGLSEVRPPYVFTSRGLGVVEIPYRLDCPAEATVITLRKG